MNPPSLDSSVSSIIIILLAGGGIQSIVTLQFLLTGIGVRSIFLGFCAALLGVWIGVVKVEPVLKEAVSMSTFLLPTIQMTSEVKPKVEELLTARVDGRIEEILKAKVGADRTAGLAIKVMVSDVTRGMIAGVILLIPFLLIDIVVQHIFRLLDFQGLSVAVVSLPLKVMLFLSVDGWAMLTDKFLS